MNEQIERFLAELARAGGVGRALGHGEAAEHLLKLLGERDVRKVAVDHSSVPVEIYRAVKEGGFEILIDDDPHSLKGAEAGISGALAAVADSGTVALGGSPEGLWQWVSLLPPLHVVFLEAEQVLPSLDEAFELIKEARAQGLEEFVLVTGPSRTADIAQTPLLGMHGPRELFALILLPR